MNEQKQREAKEYTIRNKDTGKQKTVTAKSFREAVRIASKALREGSVNEYEQVR